MPQISGEIPEGWIWAVCESCGGDGLRLNIGGPHAQDLIKKMKPDEKVVAHTVTNCFVCKGRGARLVSLGVDG